MSATISHPTVDAVLRQRGQVMSGYGQNSALLIPLDRQPALSGEDYLEFLRCFGHASFRKVARDLVRHKRIKQLDLRKRAGDSAEEYLTFLARLGVCSYDGDEATLIRPIDNIGHTTEWYIAQLFWREFDSHARWAVQLSDVRFGSDYDVIGNVGGIMAYVEVKTAAPGSIALSELAQFLERSQELAPEMAVLLVDTDDDLEKAGLVQHIEDLINEAEQPSASEVPPPTKLQYLKPDSEHPELRCGYYRHYVCNSEPTILTQLQRCVRHYHREIRGYAMLKGERRDFVAAARRLTAARNPDAPVQ